MGSVFKEFILFHLLDPILVERKIGIISSTSKDKSVIKTRARIRRKYPPKDMSLIYHTPFQKHKRHTVVEKA